ncbi:MULTISPECIES: phage regulatory CII family protein [Aeromonas]|uniref:phage regulatory CII family protein n=1 Tax=Aeromonas TaxID=642 RepID=UPI0022E76D8B|nr:MULTISPECIES: phage regulatory CII family protein [Aeromonas]MDH0308477.1 phage regulatory CII family protein [Aeromonas caviae]MDU7777604.1 phage regulatory CII family protein [Aeromonas caviae]MDX7810802.1 phage regulatory CII family protein [Aeromonas caviae]
MSNQHTRSHSHFAGACDLFKQAHNISQLAETIGMSHHVLHNKFNPACERHNLTAHDLIALYHATGDDTLFDGLLFDCGLTAVRLPDAAQVAPEARAQQALNAGAQILGVTAQATTLLAGDRVTKSHRNTVVTGIWAGIEHLVLLATEVEDRFHAIPSLACAADMARAAIGA